MSIGGIVVTVFFSGQSVYHDPFFVSVSALLGKEQFIAFYLTGGTVTATNSKKDLWDREENAQYRLQDM